MARALKLFEDYSRKDVHDIFDPASGFTRGAGLWGLQGIIPLKDKAGSFVLFVSYGRSQGDHAFDEGVSDEGILRWQSQPSQTLSDSTIRQLIAHDEAQNSIHLFLRTRIREDGEQLPYTYLGQLKYLAHDGERERPVHFLWQLLDWPVPENTQTRMRLILDGDGAGPSPAHETDLANGVLTLEPAPSQRASNAETTRKFRSVQRRYPSDAENKAVGLLGEKLVLQYEKQMLMRIGRTDLADSVRHISIEEGDGAGYDVLSYFEDGNPKYIEVKTTTGPRTSDFFLSPNEIAFSQTYPQQFELRRLFDFDRQRNFAKFYSIFGPLTAHFELTATQYKVTRLVNEEAVGRSTS